MDGSVDSTTLTALAVTLTAVGAVLTVLVYRRRGLAPGLKALALTLLPMAALLTGSLRLVVGIVSDVAGWAARLVFSPVVWLGVVLAGVAVVLYVVAGMMTSRGVGVRGRAAEKAVARGERARAQVGAGDSSAAAAPGGRTQRGATTQKAAPAGKGAAKGDDLQDMDEIEAILRKHGI